MNLSKFLDTKSGAVITVAVVGVAVLYFGEKKARQAAAAVTPTNPNNIFAGGVDAIGANLTDNANFSLGGWLYEKINGTSIEQIERQQAIDNNPLASFWAGFPTR
ncbi:hypothetical protein [Thalassotalea piscium]|uniref:Uncharacterized protein n=1 Tax=Thalassotalea piscium TaxID=1230533 RepID=A0A7X0NG58_9GAMM|nr:hypothetical protein [Thalassotalea piscium]MBB6542853.1 hypothetical protein [Thalassotalea piscium]